MNVINLSDKFNQFNEHWQPHIIASLNGQEVKIAKIKGEFPWHFHEREDELFFVVEGMLHLDFRNKTVDIGAGEMIVVPRGVEHRPRAEKETKIILFEPAGTLNTGNSTNDYTHNDPKQI